MAKNKGIVKYPKNSKWNIGLVIFIIILLYVCLNVFLYFTRENIAEYEVTQGNIAANHTYTGLILRNEKVYQADRDGYINYYAPSGTRSSVRDVIFSIDSQGTLAKQINSVTSDGKVLDASSLNKLSERLESYMSNYDENHYQELYTVKDNLNAQLTQELGASALGQLSEEINQAIANNTFAQGRADTSGIILYYVDGLEGVTANDCSPSQISGVDYQKQSLQGKTDVKQGEPIYKLVTDETWDIVIEVDAELSEQLQKQIDQEKDDMIEVRFCKDNRTAFANFRLFRREGKYYVDLKLSNSMVRYAYERYIDIELGITDKQGLKIPKSSIAEKEFYVVPTAFLSKAGDSNDDVIYVKKDNSSDISVVTPNIYKKTEDYVYISKESVDEGAVLQMPDSTTQYAINTETQNLQGVYNINKGYAVFKQIEVLYENEEYIIIKAGTPFGISLYDHIALDGTRIVENQLVSK